VKSIRVISTTAVFLILGFAAPAHARQEQQDKEKPPKQEEKAKAPQQEQKDKTQEQPAAKTAKPEEKTPPKKQDEAKPPKQEQQPKADAKQPKPAKQESKADTKQPDKSAKQTEQPQPKSQPQAKNEQSGASKPPQRTQQAIARQQSQPALRLTAVSNSRIPDARFQSNFGRQHNFRISSPRMVNGYSRFQFGGYWFGFVEPWPDGWYYTDNVYIDFIDGGYYLYNPYYPGARVSISVVL
jgi:hypothetical protein